MVCGAPGSGKTTLGRALAEHLGAVLLDQDVLTGPLTTAVSQLLADDDLDGPLLAHWTRTPRYLTLQQVGVDNVRLGHHVVLVAPFTAERGDAAEMAAWTAPLVEAGGAPPLLVWQRLPAAALMARLHSRSAERDRRKLADADAYLARVDLGPPAVAHLPVDALASIDEQVATVTDVLALGGA